MNTDKINSLPPESHLRSSASICGSSSYELTDTETRDLIQLIEQGKPLPEKHLYHGA